MSGGIYTPPPGNGSGGGGGGSYTTTTSPDTVLVATAAGSVASGKASVTFINTGLAVATVNGENLQPGTAIKFQAYTDPAEEEFVRCAQFSYDPGSGANAELTILTKD